MKRLFFISLLFLVGTGGFGQITFQKTYGGSDIDDVTSIQQTADGGYIFSGITQSFGEGGGDVYLVKTDANGDTLWTKTFGEWDTDIGFSVQQTTDSGYIITGFTQSFGAGNHDIYLVRTDATGNMLWTKTYGGAGDDLAASGQQCTDSGFVITGFTQSFGAGMNDVYLIKTNSSGDTLWTKTYGGTNDDVGYSVQQTSDGGYIISGMTQSFGAGLEDVYLIKTDPMGDTLWTKTYGGDSSDYGASVQQCADSGYIICGFTQSFGAGGEDIFLIKTDVNGNILWTRTYGGANHDGGGSVRQTTDGGYIITGRTLSFGAGSSSIYLIKTDSVGDTLWTKAFGGTDTDMGQSVQQTTDGGYIIAASSWSYGMGWQQSALLIKTDSNGNSDGCNEYNTNTIVGNAPFTVGSGAIVNNTATVVSNSPTIAGNTATITGACIPVSINQSSITNNQITIYPNPTKGEFRVESLEFGVEKIEVYDLFGRKVLESKEPEIDMSSYPAGLYIWRVGEARGKLVIE